MITSNSRDPITLWNDLNAGWLSGQEPWIDEHNGAQYYSFANLFTMRWDYHAVDGEGVKLAKSCAVKVETPPQVLNKIDLKLTQNFILEFGVVTVLNRREGPAQVHVYIPVVELVRDFLKIVHQLNILFKELDIAPMTAVAFHVMAAHFSEQHLPFLYMIFGRRYFLDASLTEVLNDDIDSLEQILSKSYQNSYKRKVWKLVANKLGEENIV